MRSLKHFKTTSSFFVFNLHQRAGKTSLFHMRGVDFTHFNTCFTCKATHVFTYILPIFLFLDPMRLSPKVKVLQSNVVGIMGYPSYCCLIGILSSASDASRQTDVGCTKLGETSGSTTCGTIHNTL